MTTYQRNKINRTVSRFVAASVELERSLSVVAQKLASFTIGFSTAGTSCEITMIKHYKGIHGELFPESDAIET